MWRALFEMFVPVERALGPAYRLLLRERASALRIPPSAKGDPVPTRVASETALQASPLPAYAEEADSLLRAYVAGIPGAVPRAVDVRPELFGYAGPAVIEPLCGLSGMIFAALTLASYSARVKWFQSLDWTRASRLLRRFRPAPPSLKASD